MKGYITQDREVCGTCKHFRQHYVWTGGMYLPISYGHCVYPARKRRRAEERCGFWTERETENAPG